MRQESGHCGTRRATALARLPCGLSAYSGTVMDLRAISRASSVVTMSRGFMRVLMRLMPSSMLGLS